MKITKKILSVAILTAITNTSWADGTLAGTNVDNTATITYSVSGAVQPVIGSSEAGNSTGGGTPTSFEVDKKIDLSVTGGSPVNVVPGATSQTITFEVLNEGNSTEDFEFTVKDDVTGDNFDPSSACSTPATISIPPSILVPPTPTTISVTCDIPSSVSNGDTSDIDLKATVVDGSGNPYTESATEAANIVDVVLADDKGSATDTGSETVTAGSGLRNATHSAVNTYTATNAAADLTVQKVAAVTNDPINGAVTPKRIPGATIVYTITVSNADGASDATHLVISDILDTDLNFGSCTVSGPAIVNPVAPNPALPVTCGFSGGAVTTSSFTLPGGSGSANVETLTITATVK